MVNLNGTLLFVAHSSPSGRELWRSDGTITGTTLVLDTYPYSYGGSPASLTVAGSHAYFTQLHPNYGTELCTDGTTAGTVCLDVNPGGPRVHPRASPPPASGAFFFTAFTPSLGVASTTPEGAPRRRLVKDINAVTSTTNPFGAAFAVGNRLFFAGNDGAPTGSELWSSDGTSDGTNLLAEIAPGPRRGRPVVVLLARRRRLLLGDGRGDRRGAVADQRHRRRHAADGGHQPPAVRVVVDLRQLVADARGRSASGRSSARPTASTASSRSS